MCAPCFKSQVHVNERSTLSSLFWYAKRELCIDFSWSLICQPRRSLSPMTETVCWKLLHSLMLWIGFSLWWPAHFGKAHFWTLNRLSLQTPFTIQLIHEWKDVIANLKHEIGASAFNANVLTKIIPLYSSRSHRREALHSLTTLNLVFHSGAYNEFPIKEKKK